MLSDFIYFSLKRGISAAGSVDRMEYGVGTKEVNFTDPKYNSTSVKVDLEWSITARAKNARDCV